MNEGKFGYLEGVGASARELLVRTSLAARGSAADERR